MYKNQIESIFSGFFSNGALELSLHEPQFSGHEWQYVKACLDTGWVSSVGKFVNAFEKALADFTGAKHAIVTVNGTAALHVSYLLAGVTKQDEVLMPTLTFVATANALTYCGATPHFIDCDEKHLGIDTKKLADYLEDIAIIKKGICYNRFTQRPIRALCVMHTFGHPVDLDALLAISQQYHLALIEDAAEALGSFYKGQHVGHHGLVGALSFNGNKIITTGGGGAILTDHDLFAKQAKHITTTAKMPHAYFYQHDRVGYNYRMPNINAALGCAQLERMDYFLNLKRALAENYIASFSKIKGIRFLTEPDFAKSNYWLNAIFVEDKVMRDDLLMQLNEKKIAVRPIWELLHHLPMYQDMPRMDLSTAERISKKIINIPSSVILGEHCVNKQSITT
ncbi:MAG: aminotransferase DegT [Gammaproteobacteria bacterium CG_4_10_14_0_8_um_filter_38_16]|nr:MAG: aminotransferase DegT [Gammaproteobacteria bacterium CG_4_10_14_0_8_um_filter_38_16]PJA04088.1 MAG: aminotransferase DegT [Gammaproteobacteria bacterium CG_4_10_14_0_2_um_filter_38_22]PJB10053.1 MAG: aminotransferase DegT [Gammaproteobacteria bacterium CG_4_9_14_3_um_filter_38_9]